MAAQGYIVVAPNRRGLPSFGQEWLDQISGDYSRPEHPRLPLVPSTTWPANRGPTGSRMGCVGASATAAIRSISSPACHEKRFKAFISHCGIFDFDSMYGETEELFFVNNDYGGPYWDTANATAQRSYANSPHKFVSKWDTPILIITGEKDFRIPYTQSLEAFTAARTLGIPARLVAFENEAHQVFKPQNSLVWQPRILRLARQVRKIADPTANEGRPDRNCAPVKAKPPCRLAGRFFALRTAGKAHP